MASSTISACEPVQLPSATRLGIEEKFNKLNRKSNSRRRLFNHIGDRKLAAMKTQGIGLCDETRATKYTTIRHNMKRSRRRDCRFVQNGYLLKNKTGLGQK